MSSNLSGYRPLGSRSPTKQPRSTAYYGRGVKSANSGRIGKNTSFNTSNTSFSRSNRSTNLDASILGDVTVNRSLLSNISLVGTASNGAIRHKTYNPDIRKLVIERTQAPENLLFDGPPRGRARRQLTNGDTSVLENSILDTTHDHTFNNTFNTTNNLSIAYPVNNFNGPITGRQEVAIQEPANLPSDYWIYPTLETLKSLPASELSQIEGLNIGRKNFGYISWPSAVDLSTTDLDSILGFLVVFSLRAVVVYPDDGHKPPLGQGLNTPAVITLEHVSKVDKRGNRLVDPTNPRVIRHRQQLQRSIEGQQGKHLSYDPASGVWVFQVPHFSRWGVPDSDSEDEGEEEQEEGQEGHTQEDIRGARGQEPYVQVPPLASTRVASGVQRPAAPPVAPIASVVPKVESVPAAAAPTAPTAAPKKHQKAIPGGWAWTAPIESDEDEEYSAEMEIEQDADEMEEDFEVEDLEDDLDLIEEDAASPISSDSDYENFRQEFAVVNLDRHERPISRDWLTQLKYSAQAGSPLVVEKKEPKVEAKTDLALTNLDSMLFTNTLVKVASEEYDKAAESLRLPSYSTAVDSTLAIFQPNGELAVKLPHKDLTLDTVTHLCRLSANFQDDTFLGSVKSDMTVSDRNNGYPRYSLDSAPSQTDLKGTVYSLASILFQSASSLGLSEYIKDAPLDVNETRQVEASLRKQHLSQWLERAVYEQVQSELSDDASANIVTLLTGNRVDEACSVCLKTNNVHLGVVISMMGSSSASQATAQAQIDHWKSTNALDLVPEYTQHVYQLAAGNIDVVCKSLKLDWMREFGLRLWFGRNRDISASIDQIKAGSTDWDLRLLRLYAGKYNLEQTLTGAAFDTAVPWVLCAFFLQSHARDAPDTADRLTLQYAAQLESMSQIEHALLVLGFLVSDEAYAQAITRFVARNIVFLRKIDLSAYRVNRKLLSEAEALLARYECRFVDEVRFLLDAQLYSVANTTVLHDVAPQAVIKGSVEALEELILQFPTPERHIASWKEGGKVYLDYARFKLHKKVNVLDLANGVSHMSKQMDANSQFETRVALHVMSDDIQRTLLLEKTTDEGTQALEILNEVTLSMKQMVYSAGMRFRVDYSRKH